MRVERKGVYLVRGDDLGLEVGTEVDVPEEGEVLRPHAGEDALVLIDGQAHVVDHRGTHGNESRRRVPCSHGGRWQWDGKGGLDGGSRRRERHGRR
jgi:hypothetical protein